MEEQKSRFDESNDGLEILSNDDMVCSNCFYRDDVNTFKCKIYQQKPNSVILGKNCIFKFVE